MGALSTSRILDLSTKWYVSFRENIILWGNTQHILEPTTQRMDSLFLSCVIIIGNGKITPERIARLEHIDFEWDPQKAQWNIMYGKLQIFQKEIGHCKVPKGYTKDPELANWVRNQRLEHANMTKNKKSRMTQDRFQLLDDLGFKWSTTMPQKATSTVTTVVKAKKGAAATTTTETPTTAVKDEAAATTTATTTTEEATTTETKVETNTVEEIPTHVLENTVEV
jgi:hypothetical protein